MLYSSFSCEERPEPRVSGRYFLTSDEQLRVKFILKLFQTDYPHLSSDSWASIASLIPLVLGMSLWLCFFTLNLNPC